MVQRQASAALLKDALSNGGAVSALLAETNKKEKKELRTFSCLIEALQQASVAELKKYLTATGSSPAKVGMALSSPHIPHKLHFSPTHTNFLFSFHFVYLMNIYCLHPSALEKVNDEDQTALHVVCARTEENADLAVSVYIDSELIKHVTRLK